MKLPYYPTSHVALELKTATPLRDGARSKQEQRPKIARPQAPKGPRNGAHPSSDAALDCRCLHAPPPECSPHAQVSSHALVRDLVRVAVNGGYLHSDSLPRIRAVD